MHHFPQNYSTGVGVGIRVGMRAGGANWGWEWGWGMYYGGGNDGGLLTSAVVRELTAGDSGVGDVLDAEVWKSGGDGGGDA
ncbi:hypothetical protein LIER_34405 [Lithospermum erythrorhizon]|uniref:Uncharacterized protein n=1 Tax=Lithospermum erythrorhizon TaxID=34254 RepID=A0AAV3S0V0_LITER